MRATSASLLCLLLGFAPLVAFAQEHSVWNLEGAIGNAYDFDSRLKIKQGDAYRESINARFATHGFENPLYYSVRLARWQEDRAWELQLIHHKLYLQNPPPGVTSLSISHGFNIVTINRVMQRNAWIWRIGVGPVITHTEANVNGIAYDGRYELSGGALLASVGRRFHFGRRGFISADIAGSVGYVESKLNDSLPLKVSAYNFALHGLVGVGMSF